VILAPLTVFLVMFVVQIGLVYHGRSVLSAAAQDALRAAQTEGSGSGDGYQAADRLLAGSDDMLTNRSVSVSRGVDMVTVTISADIPSLVPFWSGGVTATASGPTERFRPEAER
jgi:Flp pilus assembly protein TadG